MQIETLRDKLRRLADDCEERARIASEGSKARGLLHEAARDARRAGSTRHTSEAELQAALQAMEALAQAARWYDGEIIYPAMPAQPERPSPAIAEPIFRRDVLNARQLAELYGMSERGARKAIERGVDRALPGYYRDGCHLYAEPEAFEADRAGRCRIGSE